jgi:hypothetical protein
MFQHHLQSSINPLHNRRRQGRACKAGWYQRSGWHGYPGSTFAARQGRAFRPNDGVMMIDFEIDIDQLIKDRLFSQGGTEDDFKKIDKLIVDYSQRTGMPEDGIAMIILDCMDGGYSKDDVEKHLRVYDSKRTNALVAYPGSLCK